MGDTTQLIRCGVQESLTNGLGMEVKVKGNQPGAAAPRANNQEPWPLWHQKGEGKEQFQSVTRGHSCGTGAVAFRGTLQSCHSSLVEGGLGD